ncbi:Cof-type HAD-IIB family hydrolase [Roseofilum casamattae]|uniref:Cof-type HAD-IIB family hydrolase n=1 Tax=Roseofilum casamattae BLCC-M143 TaxID=3022442 RepID=A0ABT7BTK0_9CYAN|nr:Cof-type HAD-IIB family hydrolase [Roseofilum casamattae]MDJ1182122.1 Cof-type HAD-IIB family hydrolase [Roseofilum casamattae BLCC-M143]
MSSRSQIELLILDIDGTIAGESNQVTQPVIDTISKVQALGIPVAIATGRMFFSACRFYQAIGSQLPLICYNGALIKHPQTEKVYRHIPVSIPLAREIIDVLETSEYRDRLGIHFYLNDQLYVRELSDDTRNYIRRSSAKVNVVGDLRSLLDTGENAEPTKILALSADTELIAEVSAYLSQSYAETQLHFTCSTPTFLEITNPAANKGRAIQYLAETILGISIDRVMAIGDNFNDLEMIKCASIGVAMGNSPPEIQKIADWVAPDVEDDGAIAAIERFILC